jgi:uncharacterized protein YgiM (DUF1202 family)
MQKQLLWQYRYWFLVGLLVSMAALGLLWHGRSSTTTAHPLSVGTVVQAVGPVRIREAPSIDSQRLSYIPWGESAQIIAVDPSGEWYQIEYQGVLGWSSSNWFVLVETARNSAQAADVQPLPPGAVTVQAVDSVRIRSLPSVQADQIGTMAWGDVAQVLAVDSSGQWYQVNFNGLVGWSAAPWLRPSDPAQLSAPVAVSQTATHVRATGNVRLRAEPNTESAILETVYVGRVALYLGVDASGQWYQVRYNDQEGWSFAEYWVILTEPIPFTSTAAASGSGQAAQAPANESSPSTTVKEPSNTPSASEVQAPPPQAMVEAVEESPLAAIGSVVRLTRQPISPIYVSPNMTSGTLGVVRQGERSLLLAIDSTQQWYQVNHQGVIGWVSAADFEATDETLDPASLILPTPQAPVAAPQTEAETPTEEAPSVAEPADLASPIGQTLAVQAIVTGLFAAPQANGQVIGTLRRGDEVEIVAMLTTTRVWYQVQSGDLLGWVVASQLSR